MSESNFESFSLDAKRGSECVIGLRSVKIFEIAWEMKMRTRLWFSAKNDHFRYFWFSNFFFAGIKKLCIKIHSHTIKIFLAEYTETLRIAKKWLFWPNFLFCRSTLFLNRFQKFQRIWDLWKKDFFHTKLEKKFWDSTQPNIFFLAPPHIDRNWIFSNLSYCTQDGSFQPISWCPLL